MKQRVEYLGHVVTPEGTFPDPSKVEVVNNFPTPTSLKEWKTFWVKLIVTGASSEISRKL